MGIKEYYLEDDIKKQLGYIIRENRKQKLLEYKNKMLIEYNPYTKENFCENNAVCHYHTLTKLESDLITENSVYHLFLKKLDLYYQVSPEEHRENMEYVKEKTEKILRAGEYMDDECAKECNIELEQVNFNKDIIAHYYLYLLKIFIKLQLINKIDEDTYQSLVRYANFYQGIHYGIAMHCLGIYYLNQFKTSEAKECFLKAKKVYDKHKISKGLISSYLIAVYVYTNDYYHSVPLCNRMKNYYKKNNNYKRLMHVYNYLSDYYLLINAHDIAKKYFNKAIEIIDNDETLTRYKYALYYNWGFRCFKEFRFEEALDNFKKSLTYCKNKVNKIQIINYILIIMTKLNYPTKKLIIYCKEGEKYVQYSNEINLHIFKYFRFKLKNSKYYRRFAYEKLIPLLSKKKNSTEVLLFFYQDLYK